MLPDVACFYHGIWVQLAGQAPADLNVTVFGYVPASTPRVMVSLPKTRSSSPTLLTSTTDDCTSPKTCSMSRFLGATGTLTEPVGSMGSFFSSVPDTVKAQGSKHPEPLSCKVYDFSHIDHYSTDGQWMSTGNA